ncbi:sugar ABC transporter permease [Streptomyces sp. NPDC002588]|uniref:sugar ABC transporter permease n=1 Tax=Streptomyces sp. NPDC002588 TaxID=3154419 RepID=UPI00331CD76F
MVRRRLHARDLGPAPVLLALAVTWVVFQSLNRNFLSPRNLSVLSVDIVGTGMVAVGIVFVLLIGEIDLSVGSLAGLAGAVFAALNVTLGMPEWLAVITALGCGAAAGAIHGFSFARIGVPAFVVTLAGLLAWNGLMLYLLGPDNSINFSEDGLVAQLTSRYYDAAVATYGLAALATAAYLLASYLERGRRGAAGMPYRPVGEIWARTALLAVVAFASVYVLNRFEGLPLALLIFLAVIVASDLFLRRTPYGRQILALGGGVEAARRAGVDVTRVRISVFVVSGTLAAAGGLFVASRLTSASQVPGSGMLLINAIAAAVIGGTSLFGGRGSPWSALLGVLIIQSIGSGMALLGIEPPVQFMVTGGVLYIAVVFDSLARRTADPYRPLR